MKIRNRITAVLVIIILCITYFSTNVYALTKTQEENANKIGCFLVSELGLKPYVAFGVLGNIYQESKCDPSAMNPNGASGICQWMGFRKEKMLKQCKSDWKNDLNGQLKYLKYELTGPKSGVYNKLKNLPDTKEGMKKATEIFCKEFEICGNYDIEISKRYKQAEKLYKKFTSKESSLNLTTRNFPIR